MKKILNKLNIRQKISSGFIILLAIFLIIGLTSVLTLKKSRNIDNKISNIYIPSNSRLNEFEVQVKYSKDLINNWIYIANIKEKEILKALHSSDFSLLKKKLLQLVKLWNNPEHQEKLIELLGNFELIISDQETIMNNLSTMDDYDDDIKIEQSISLFEDKIDINVNVLLEELSELIQNIKKVSEDLVANKYSSFNTLERLIIISSIFTLGLSLVILLTLPNIISKPIDKLKIFILELGKGNLPKKMEIKNNDEIGEISTAINILNENLKNTRDFAVEVGNGKFDTTVNIFDNQGEMGVALAEMRNSLKKVSDDQAEQRRMEEQRNWNSTGIAKFSEIMRNSHEDLKDLGFEVISTLINYLGANQGGLFLVNNENEKDIFIELIAMFAYDRKKHIEKKIQIGEGLIGNCYLEKKTIFLTEIPDNYIKITSGLGQANPNSLLIVPLMLNQEIFGMVEIASFSKFEEFQIEFIEQVGEIIASVLSSVKINLRTTGLLEATKQSGELLRSQEEELRQNMEELTSTQESMQIKEQQLLEKIQSQQEEIDNLKQKLKVK